MFGGYYWGVPYYLFISCLSIEECEALCTRVGIKVHVERTVLGVDAVFEIKFARGYSLTDRVSSTTHLT